MNHTLAMVRALAAARDDMDQLDGGFAWALRHRHSGTYLTELHESGAMAIRVWMRRRHAERDLRAWGLEDYEIASVDLYEKDGREFYNAALGLLGERT